MRRFRDVDLKKMPAWRISSIVLYAMIAVTAVVYMLFFFVGYNNYDYDYPMFKAPVFTDTLLWLMYIMIGITVAIIIASAAKWLKPGISREKAENGIPVAKIAYSMTGLLVVCMVVTFVAGSQDMLVINGKKYTDGFWLKAADMFIYTILLLFATATVLVAYGLSGYGKRNRQKKGKDDKAKEA